MIDEMTVTRLVFAAPERCHALIADVGAYGDWARDLKDVSIDEVDDHGRAAVATFRVGAMGRSASYTLRYDHSSAPNAVRWELVEGDIVRLLDGSYEFGEVDGEPDQTQIRYHLRVELAVPLPGFVKRRAEGRIMHAALDDLQARVEGGPESADEG